MYVPQANANYEHTLNDDGVVMAMGAVRTTPEARANIGADADDGALLASGASAPRRSASWISASCSIFCSCSSPLPYTSVPHTSTTNLHGIDKRGVDSSQTRHAECRHAFCASDCSGPVCAPKSLDVGVDGPRLSQSPTAE